MNRHDAQSWYRSLSQSDKVVVLLCAMHELTISVRGIVQFNASDCETRSRLMYAISELNHRLTSAAWGLIEGRNTYPDDEIVDMLFTGPIHPELASEFPHVLERAREYMNGRR